MLTIEFEEPSTFACSCCGRTTVRLTRFVHKEGDAFAVYYAQFTPGHPERRVVGLVGLGEWGEGARQSHRVAFPFEIWTTNDNYAVSLVNAADSPWKDATLLGKLLDRDEALRHEWKADVFHITDHIVADDPEVKRYFGGNDA